MSYSFSANGTQKQAIKEVLKPILYADVFDCPLTAEEIYKFLEFKTDFSELERLLAQAVEAGQIGRVDGYYSLINRPELAQQRQIRNAAARKLWPKAIYYGRLIASLPFVRMVAITGSLAVNNPRNGMDDIDYLIVTKPNRLWLCRAIIILLVKLTARKGIYLCPNYILTENVLEFDENNLYTAREMVQMIPLYGGNYYLKIRELNGWVTDFLPQGTDLNLGQVDDSLSFIQRSFKKASELMLGGWGGNYLEQKLQAKQIAKHTLKAKQMGTLDKVVFNADKCKGHYDGHNYNTMQAYNQRILKHNL